MSATPNKWHAVSVTVPPDHAEAVEYAFNGLDSLGSEIDLLSNSDSGRCTVTAYFSAPQDEALLLEEIENALRIHGKSTETDFALRTAEIENQDWLAEWKKYWKPVEIGRFVVAAPWHEVNGAGKNIIRIEPNMAFGTGTHETTQLCLEAIDEHYNPGQSFLDVGTGTGILAIAATLISTNARIKAVDNDADAVDIARDNAAMNNVAGRIEFKTGTLADISDPFDLVTANLTADVIVPILPDLIEKTSNTLVLSGILVEQENFVVSQLPANLSHEVRKKNEWISIIVRTDENVENRGESG